MIIIKIILILSLIITMIMATVAGIDKKILEELKYYKEEYYKFYRLYQNEQSKTDTLYRIIFFIKRQLSYILFKDCPEEEKINIPKELIMWINEIDEIKNGENKDGVHQ